MSIMEVMIDAAHLPWRAKHLSLFMNVVDQLTIGIFLAFEKQRDKNLTYFEHFKHSADARSTTRACVGGHKV